MDHPFVVAFLTVCALLFYLMYVIARRRNRNLEVHVSSAETHHFVQLRLGTVPRKVAIQKGATELRNTRTPDPICQLPIRRPLLCDICHKRVAIGYKKGASGEPDSIIVYCQECGGAGMTLF